MVEINREQIIKALECLLSTDYDGREFCEKRGCSYSECENCLDDALKDALSLIKELTEENEKLKAQKYYIHSDGRIEMIPTVESVRADTVRQMQERLKQYIDVGHYRPATEICLSELAVANIIDQIAKEMLDNDST